MIFQDATFSLTLKIYLSEKVENYYHQFLQNSQDTTSALIGKKTVVDCTGKPVEN